MGHLPVATHGQTTHRLIINGPLSHGIHGLLACGHTSSNSLPISRLPVATHSQATHRPACGHPPPLGRLPVVTHHPPSTCQWPPIAFQLLSPMGCGHPRPLASVSRITHCCLLVATNHHWPICPGPPIINRSPPSLVGHFPVTTHH